MIFLTSPDDFLAQCYQVADLVAVIGQFVNQFLTLFGIDVPDLRAACFQIFTFIGG